VNFNVTMRLINKMAYHGKSKPGPNTLWLRRKEWFEYLLIRVDDVMESSKLAGRAGRAFVDVEGLIVHVMFDKIDWRKKEWRKLVAFAKARTLKSGLIQIVTEILERLSREGVLDRDDAWEYLANAREAWRSPEEEAAVAERLAAGAEYDADGDDDEDGGDDEEETIDEEPLSQIVERLDATVTFMGLSPAFCRR
jgi:hypothetical protein